MRRGWYRRRHVDRDVAGILAQTQAAEFTLHILRGGALFRVIREVQERYFRPPELIPGGSGKYGR